MRKRKLIMTVMKEKRGYSAHANVGITFIGTQANSLSALRSKILDAVNLALGAHSKYHDADIELRRSFTGH